jgi:hypothetical protein
MLDNLKQLVKNAPKLLIPSMLVAIGGCSSNGSSTSAESVNDAPVALAAPPQAQTEPPAAVPVAVKSIVPKPPVQIAIWKDDTGSTVISKIPTLQFAQIEKLVRSIAPQQALELRFGNIGTDSNLPLAQIYIPEPPVAPAASPVAPTLESVRSTLELPKLRSEYQQKLAAYQQQMAAYQQEVAKRDRTIESELARFKRGFEQMPKKPAQHKVTDIYGMLKRTDLYLNEANPTWAQVPRKIALLITDGLETASTKPQPLQWQSQAEVLLVSSGGEVGVLQPLLKTTPFESIDGAIRYITAQ